MTCLSNTRHRALRLLVTGFSSRLHRDLKRLFISLMHISLDSKFLLVICRVKQSLETLLRSCISAYECLGYQKEKA